ncbi:MAG: response regulator transcription factor [Anaerolineales bacterium]|nr:MAG: response regulator transcription factor [Anaerolineales bacterium]
MARILAIDDEENIRDLIKRGLLGHEVTTAPDGPAGLAEAHRFAPDLILLDVTMPKMTGYEVCRQLRATPSLMTIPVIFLTARGTLDDKLEGFDAGADDYVPKPFDMRELEVRVHAVLRRAQPYASAETLQVGGLTLDVRSREASSDKNTCILTPTEFSLLDYMMRRPGEILPTYRLLEEVWDYPPGVGDPALVRMHIRNLREKLEENPSQPEFILTLGRQGYVIKKD